MARLNKQTFNLFAKNGDKIWQYTKLYIYGEN